MKMPTPQFLEQRKAIILSDLKMKVEAEDWHGVQDCASDIREIEAQLKCVADLGLVTTSVKTSERCESEKTQPPCEHEWRYYLMTGVESCQLCGAQREPVTHETR